MTSPGFRLRRGLHLVVLIGLAVFWFASRSGARAQTIDLGSVCGRESVLTLLGVDTSGVALFALAEGQGAIPGWILEVGSDLPVATLYPDWTSGRHFGGSFGPGGVLAVERCGPECLQVVRWEQGEWSPVAEQLGVARGTVVHLTYDPEGVPWTVLHGSASSSGMVAATAYRLEGDEWAMRGALQVRAVASPGALPDWSARDAIVSGTGRFAAGVTPSGWLEGLPALPVALQGQVTPLGPGEGLYLAADGDLFVTENRGGKWWRLDWNPWGPSETALRRGIDYSVDRPSGSVAGPGALAWFDHREDSDTAIVLSKRGSSGWEVLARIPQTGDSSAVSALPYEHLLRFDDGDWLLISGCQPAEEGRSGLGARRFRNGRLLPAEVLPFAPSWLGSTGSR